MNKYVLWLSRHDIALTMAAACVAPILYLLYVMHYAVNVIQGDEWFTVPIIHSALHDQLSFGQLWVQHNETRIFVGNLVFVAFGLFDRFDVRSIILFNAAVLVASYAVLLVLVRHYIGRLSPILVLLVGLVWCSLADVENALWAFQLPWYLTVLFLVAMVFALTVPRRRRLLWFLAALLVAVVASLTIIQGFLLWPLGAVCILWCQSWGRRTVIEVALWAGVMIATIGVYVPGFQFIKDSWSTRFFVVLLGNVVPGGYWSSIFHPLRNYDRFEVAGVALLAGAAYIGAQSWRKRTTTERFPLPLLLIGFALSFDALITSGRSQYGVATAVSGNRYVMPNLILLTGIAVYAWKHLPSGRPRANASWLGTIALVIFLVVQLVVAIGFGLDNGQLTEGYLTNQARLVVNLRSVPPADRPCELHDVIWLGLPVPYPTAVVQVSDARRDGLGTFIPSSHRYYRRLGLPALLGNCTASP